VFVVGSETNPPANAAIPGTISTNAMI